MNLHARCRAAVSLCGRLPAVGGSIGGQDQWPGPFANRSAGQCRHRTKLHFYRKRSYQYTRPRLLPPKEPSALTPTEQQFAIDPLVSLLKSPLRQCMFSRRMLPSDLMVRFIRVQDTKRKQIWLVPDGLGGQPRRGGIGYWISGRRSVMNMLGEKNVRARINGDAFIRPDIADFVDSLLAHEVALEMRRCVQACIIKQLRLRSSSIVEKRDDDRGALTPTGKSVANQPNPCLFSPAPDALFDAIDAPWDATTAGRHSARLVVPPAPHEPSLASTEAHGNVHAAEHPPVFDLGQILNVEDMRMVRAALGLRKASQHTLQFALLHSERTSPLIAALWRWRFYQQ